MVGNYEFERFFKVFDVVKGVDFDGVLNFSYVRGYVVVFLIVDVGRYLKVLLLYIGIDNVV